MDRITSKWRNIVLTAKRPSSDDIDVSCLTLEPAVARYKAHHDPFDQTYDPHLIQELIENIDTHYYSAEDDTARLEIERATTTGKTEVEPLRRRLLHLDKQNKAVSKRVAELILEKQPSYQTELQRVIELQRTNLAALNHCLRIRGSLKIAENGLTRSRLLVVANSRRRGKLREVINSLRRIATLQQTVTRLYELIEKEDFCGAIELHRECQEVVEDYKQYLCINKLSSQLKNIKMNIDEGLDGVLMRTCENFDKDSYTTLQKAFRLQGNTQSTVNQLQMHYTTAIHKRAHRIVLGYVELCYIAPTEAVTSASTHNMDLSTRSYVDLCKLLTKECLIPCLTDLCKGLWVILRCYHQATLWHKEEAVPTVECSPPEGCEAAGSATGGNNEQAMWHDYILGKMTAERLRMWTDMANKVRPVLEAVPLTTAGFQFEEIIRILAVIKRLVQVGNEFCGAQSSDLQEVVRRQIKRFFQSFHQMQLDRLRMFLENEGWELCPVKPSFTFLDLMEFRPFRGILSPTANSGSTADHSTNGLLSVLPQKPSHPKSGDTDSVTSEGLFSSGEGSTYFVAYASSETNPFDFPVDVACVEDIMDEEEDPGGENGVTAESAGYESEGSSDGEQLPSTRPPEVRRHSSGASTRLVNRRRCTGPILANTTIEVFRLMGRYMQMLRLLQPIGVEVTYATCQLFEYYFYSIYHFFAQDKTESVQRIFTPRLRASLKRISERLILSDADTSRQQQDRIPAPELSPMIPLTSLDTLPCRVVAIESLCHLTEVLYRALVPYLRDFLPEEKRGFLGILQEQSLPAAWDLRQPVYQSFAVRCLDYDRIPQIMAGVNWNTREMGTKWSSYTDKLSEMLNVFVVQLSSMEQRVPLPASSQQLIWNLVLRGVGAALVEGFSAPTQCTPEGRSLMLLDLQQYLARAEKLTSIRPIPGKDVVEDFIKAFYVPVHEFEGWIREHKERYSRKQLTNLIHCVAKDRKTRQRILACLADSE